LPKKKFPLPFKIHNRGVQYHTAKLSNPPKGLKRWIKAFVTGYKISQSKQFTLEDMIGAAKYGYEFRDTTSFPEHKFEDSCINNFKQHIQSKYKQQLPKEFISQVQYKDGYGFWYKDIPELPDVKRRLKITTNSEGKEELVGIYKY